jgi:outer membrane lipoprotein carrier protein
VISFNTQAEFLPKSFSAKFTQEYLSSLKGKIKKGNGSVDYKYPSNLRFETNNPTHVLFISNGKKSWYYTYPFIDGEDGELTESNGKDGMGVFIKFFDALNMGLASNNLYTVLKNNTIAEIIFNEKSAGEIGIKRAKLNFKEKKYEFSMITSIELEFLDGKKSTMALSEMKINSSIPDDFFIFKAPKNTKLIKR